MRIPEHVITAISIPLLSDNSVPTACVKTEGINDVNIVKHLSLHDCFLLSGGKKPLLPNMQYL